MTTCCVMSSHVMSVSCQYHDIMLCHVMSCSILFHPSCPSHIPIIFLYEVFNFFFNVFAGSALLVIGAIIDHPTDLIWYLGHSLPQLSTFFTTYIMLRSLSG